MSPEERREAAADWELGHARPMRWVAGVEGIEDEDDEPRPDEIGPTPRWFIVAFSIAVLLCGVCSVLGALAYFLGWIG